MSLIIRDVQIIDGEGRPPFKADVLIQKNIISAIGHLKSRRARQEIAGLGNYLVPGFIDPRTNVDHYLTLFSQPDQKNLLAEGVTTIIGGHCGASLAPLLYGSLESIRKWADPDEININWHTMKEFLTSLERLKLGVNFGTLVGHSTIRRALIGDSARRLSKKELVVMKNVLRQALEEGAFGLSSGLGYVHGRLASTGEIKELVNVVAQFDGVYTVHLRNETDRLLASVEEIISLAKQTKARTIISHLRPIKGFEHQFELALGRIEKAAASASIYFDIAPVAETLEEIYTLLPQWVQVGNLETMTEKIKDPRTAILIKKEWWWLDPEAIRIVSAPGHDYLAGKDLKEIAASLALEPMEALLYLMRATGLRATILHRNVNPTLVEAALGSKRACIASGSNGLLPLTAFSDFLQLVREKKLMPLESAIQKITAAPATLFGLKDRGVVKEGRVADLAIVGKNDYLLKEVIIGGKIAGEEQSRGVVLRRRR
jgi:N-acyl-D-aspartate/D-glutamate deacylase